MTASSNFPDLRPGDLATFLSVVRCRSFSGAARQLGVTPSQVSKAVARIEEELGERLLVRDATGAVPSEAGRRVLPVCEEIVSRVHDLRATGPLGPRLTIAGTALLSAVLLPRIMQRLPGTRLRSIELPPGVALGYAGTTLFDVALTTAEEPWPQAWDVVRLGYLRRGLFASPALAQRLGPQPVAPAKLVDHAFVRPVYSFQGQTFPGDDGCPLSASERRFGHETQTAALALELASDSEELVFVQEIAARPFLKQKRVVEVPVQGWNVMTPLFLVCHAARVSARVRRETMLAIRSLLPE